MKKLTILLLIIGFAFSGNLYAKVDSIHKAKKGTSHSKMVCMKNELSGYASSIRIDVNWLHAKYPDPINHDKAHKLFVQAQKDCGAY